MAIIIRKSKKDKHSTIHVKLVEGIITSLTIETTNRVHKFFRERCKHRRMDNRINLKE